MIENDQQAVHSVQTVHCVLILWQNEAESLSTVDGKLLSLILQWDNNRLVP